MTDLTFTDPRRYLPFADPAFAPDWPSRDDPDRPSWPPSASDKQRFIEYCIKQLDELDRRARVWTNEEQELYPKIVAAFAKRDWSKEAAIFQTLKDAGLSWEENERLKRRRAKGQTGPGPTKADPVERANSPVARAAQDMAKLRFVIFPRFWARKELTRPSVEEIAGARRGCKPSAAASWYENERVAADWRMV